MLNRAAVLGSPIAHSLSPALHRAAYASLGLSDWDYSLLEVADADGLAAALSGGWAGLSLTMPLKRIVLPMLDVVTNLARDVGAVNTVTFGQDGRTGHNTDVEGIVGALAEARITAVSPGAGVVIGGGATATSAVAALARLGDDAPTVVVRDATRCADLLAAAGRLGVRPQLVAWGSGAPARATCVVSTVPASGSGGVVVPSVVAGVLLDVVYDPWPTSLALAWRRAGGHVVSGLEMLVHQAVGQVRLMTGLEPAVAVLRDAGLAQLSRGRVQD